MSTQELFEKFENGIRRGQLPEAQRGLLALTATRLPRPARLRYANLCRRAGLAGLALRTLAPLIHPARGLRSNASPAEYAEYAGSLVEIGAGREARRILDRIAPDAAPDVHLFHAFALFQEWHYAEAIPLLLKFIAGADSDYRALVGQVNLAAALLATGEQDRATRAIDEAISSSTRADARRLLGNCLELRAQAAIAGGDFQEALRALDEAGVATPETGGKESYFLRKWRAICEFRMGRPGGAQAVHDLRVEAQTLGHWEGIRDCDLHVAVVAGDEQGLTRLFHGSPSPSFRQRLRTAVPGFRPPTDYLWRLGDGEGRELCLWNPTQLAEDLGVSRARSLPLQLLECLGTDIYAPLRTGGLFGALYPDSYYDPFTSPNRVQEQVSRLRRALQTGHAGIQIETLGSAYRLSGAPGGRLRIAARERPATREEALLNDIRRALEREIFPLESVARCLGISARSAHRLVAEWMAAGALVRSGQGRATRYRLTG